MILLTAQLARSFTSLTTKFTTTSAASKFSITPASRFYKSPLYAGIRHYVSEPISEPTESATKTDNEAKSTATETPQPLLKTESKELEKYRELHVRLF